MMIIVHGLKASGILSEWFSDNYLKANPAKHHVLLSETCDTQSIVANISIASSCCGKLLGIIIDQKLSFESHIESLCKKASQKLNRLSRMASSLKFEQRKWLLNAFITAKFSYAPVIWMFYCRKLNNRINYIHERTLRLVYKITLDLLMNYYLEITILGFITVTYKNL